MKSDNNGKQLNNLKKYLLEHKKFDYSNHGASVLNGIDDISVYGDLISTNRPYVLEILKSINEEEAESILNIMLAEIAYQKNECFDALIYTVFGIACVGK